MDAIMQLSQFVQRRKTMVVLIVGIVLGLLLGLAVGWWWWPVEWTNSTPGNLRSDFQDDYVLWVANQYAATGDLEWARGKLGVEFWKEGDLAKVLGELEQERSEEERLRLRALAQALGTTPVPPAATEPTPNLLQRLGPLMSVCGVLLLLVLVVVAAWFGISRLRSSRVTARARRGAMAERLAAGVAWGPDGPPLAQFPTTYVLGDDHYDPSFSVELESGEFMGECGVGVSETIGVGAPNKVTAFEVWLFDKSDIRTVTKVLMSDYAFHDEALCAKLAPKGEPVLAQVGGEIVLETKTLRVRARIVEVEYGTGNLPPQSFFERLTIDLAAWGKSGGMEAAFEDDDATFPAM